eukprot:11581419-Ditylum_brightwellii.AAC.1
MHQEEEVLAGATILITSIITIHQQVDVVAGEDMLIMKVVVHTIMKCYLECKLQKEHLILVIPNKVLGLVVMGVDFNIMVGV